jgi:SAM-dependent methyltransferase
VNRLMFWWRYVRGSTPWDTGLTPPEIVAVAERLPPGRALDLGCGTGTNSLYLAERGWKVTGIDFVAAAIRRARQKAAAAKLSVDFRVADVTRLDFLQEPYDLAFDVGCLHSLSPQQQRDYVTTLARLLCPDALYVLYAFAPRQIGPRHVGLTPDQVVQRFGHEFIVETMIQGQDKGDGPASAWYWLRRIDPSFKN